MRVQSIWTAIQIRDPARDGFLGSARQMAFGKMNRIAELQHVSQKVRPMAEALQNAGHLSAARLGSPLVVNLGDIAGRVGVFDDVDLGRFAGHGARNEWLEYITPNFAADISRKVEITAPRGDRPACA